MSNNSLPISRLINVGINLSPQAAQAQNTSTLLILGSSDVINVGERQRSYATMAAVAADFGTTSPEYLAANLWFQQAPQPTTLMIGRWAKTAAAGKLLGGLLTPVQQAIALWNAITTPAFYIIINGIPKSIAPASFAAATNLNGIATLIQTALAAASVGTTCVWNSVYSRFEIESGTTGVLSSISFAKPPTATGTITFAVNPVNNSTITLNGTLVTFVTGAPVGSQVQIGGTLAITLASLLTFLNASADVQLVKFTYLLDPTVTILELTAATAGAGGNSLTIAASVATVSAATLSGGSGTDISGMLEMNAVDTAVGAYAADGIAAESALAAATLFDLNYGQAFYGLTIPEASPTDHTAVGGYIESANNKHLYGVSSTDAGILSGLSSTDVAALLQALGYTHTTAQYSSTVPQCAASLLGRALTVDYNGNNTVITLMYKQEPGIVAENLNATQIGALEAKNCNVFTAYNNATAIIEPGKVASGAYIDEITGADWLALTVATALYNRLYTSPTKIPQTDAGNHILVVTAEAVLSQAAINGLLAPGVWDSQGFGTLNEGDFMPKGFYVYAPPVASQSQSDRAARKSVSIQIAAKFAGAIHTVNVAITFSR